MSNYHHKNLLTSQETVRFSKCRHRSFNFSSVDGITQKCKAWVKFQASQGYSSNEYKMEQRYMYYFISCSWSMLAIEIAL